MYRHKKRADAFQHRLCDRSAVDAAGRSAVAGKRSFKAYFAVFGCDAELRQLCGDFSLYTVKHRGHARARLSGPHQLTPGTVAKQKIYTVDNYRFTGAGLAGHGGKSALRLKVERADDGYIFNVKRSQQKPHLPPI